MMRGESLAGVLRGVILEFPIVLFCSSRRGGCGASETGSMPADGPLPDSEGTPSVGAGGFSAKCRPWID
jgi:hypothetical protein